MALTDKIADDRKRVFLNLQHFASEHTWNGVRFLCVTDEEIALKRKNNNVVDISWDNNTLDTVIYVREEDFPGRPIPNERGYFDGMYMKIMQRNGDMGILTLVLATTAAKAVAYT